MRISPRQRRSRGFTLLEMTFAIGMSLGIAAMLVGLMQQQVSFTRLLTQFRFLREEAPNINTLMTTMLNKADSYRIYTSTGNASTAPSHGPTQRAAPCHDRSTSARPAQDASTRTPWIPMPVRTGIASTRCHPGPVADG